MMFQGKLLYCFPPPDFDQSHDFNSHLMEHVTEQSSTGYDLSLDSILPSVTNPSQVNFSCDLVAVVNNFVHYRQATVRVN